MKTSCTSNDRPLSPHLQIYKPQITSVLSILHRITGVVAFGSVFILVGIIYVLFKSPSCFTTTQSFLTSFPGLILTTGWLFSLAYHLCNGIRHLFWDAGMNYEIAETQRANVIVLLGTIVLTAAAWFLALM